MNVEEVIAIAEAHVKEGNMETSAKSCLEDAKRHAKEGNGPFAIRWAIWSLKYSVGVFHPDYARALGFAT